MASPQSELEAPTSSKSSASRRVAEDLRDKIARGIYAPGSILPGRRTLASYYRVAHVTIEQSVKQLMSEGLLRAEHGRGTFVAEGVIGLQGEQGAIERHAYIGCDHTICQPPQQSEVVETASESRASGSLRLGIYFQDPESFHDAGSYIAQMVLGARRALDPHAMRHSLIFVNTADLERIPSMSRSEISGLLVGSPDIDMRGHIDWLSRSVLPTVVVGSTWAEMDALNVDCDNVSGMRSAVDMLTEKGHTVIACVDVQANRCHHSERWRIFQNEMAKRGLGIRPEHVVEYWKPRGEEIIRAVRNLMSSPSRPTALITLSPTMAANVVRLANELSLRIPEDLSIVTFGDTLPDGGISPGLASVTVSFEQMGAIGMSLLIDRCEGKAVDQRTEVLPMRTTVGASIAKPASF